MSSFQGIWVPWSRRFMTAPSILSACAGWSAICWKSTWPGSWCAPPLAKAASLSRLEQLAVLDAVLQLVPVW
jgi:4-hydroxy-tetrahydrodipicolinate synthase